MDWREIFAPELRSYDTFAINYSRIMSGADRRHCLPAGEGKRGEILRVGPLFSSAGIFSSGERAEILAAQILGGGTRFHAEICGFIGNSYEGRGSHANPTRKLDELRTIVRDSLRVYRIPSVPKSLYVWVFLMTDSSTNFGVDFFLTKILRH